MPFVKFSPSPKPSNSALSTRYVLVYLIFCVFCLNTPCLGVLPTAWEDSWTGRRHTIELSHSLIVELLLKRWVRRTWPKIFCTENTTTVLFTTNGSVDSCPEALRHQTTSPAHRWQGLAEAEPCELWGCRCLMAGIWMGSLCQPNYVGSIFIEISCDIWAAIVTVVFFFTMRYLYNQ